MARFLVALLFLAVAITTSEADDNHQEQITGTCGHHLTKVECDAYAAANNGAGSTSTQVSLSNKPQGCFKIPAIPADPADPDANPGSPLSFQFNIDTSTSTSCSSANPCICDRLVGSFDASTVACNSLGFDPTFTYNPSGETQDVRVDITLESGQTNGADDTDCQATKSNSASASNTVIKGDFNAAFTSQITFGTVAAPKCGGTLTHYTDAADSNKKKIQYKVSATAVVTRTFRNKIQRKRKFSFTLECLMVRDVRATTDEGFTVVEELVVANAVDEATADFNFAATLKLYDSQYAAPKTEAVTPKNNEKIYAQVVKGEDQDLFVYSVEKCYATINNDPNPADANHKDTFFENKCHLDETVDFYVDSATSNFRLEIQAFSFTTGTPTSDVVYLHCDLKVCLAADASNAAECEQTSQSECAAVNNNRRRRDVSYKTRGYQMKTISSSQPILLEGSQFHAPQCGDGFVYDRVSQECSRSNLIEITGIHLATDVFKTDFYNTSSKAFKDMAKEKEYLLWVLVKATGQDKTIRGIQVIGARPGSVILEVLIKYADNVTPKQAFDTFKQVIETPAQTTRVQNILQITQERILEYVPFVAKENKSDPEKLILIIVVVALFVVVFIAVATLFKVKQVRQQQVSPQPAVGFENKGIDA